MFVTDSGGFRNPAKSYTPLHCVFAFKDSLAWNRSRMEGMSYGGLWKVLHGSRCRNSTMLHCRLTGNPA